MRAPHARTESMAPHPTHRKHDEIRSPLNTPDQSRISSTKASTRTPYHSGLTNTCYPLEEFEHIHLIIHVSPTHPIHYKSFNTYTVSLLSLTHIIHYKNFNTHTRTHARTHTHTLSFMSHQHTVSFTCHHPCLTNTPFNTCTLLFTSHQHTVYYSYAINRQSRSCLTNTPYPLQTLPHTHLIINVSLTHPHSYAIINTPHHSCTSS